MEHLARKELHKTEGRLTKQESVLASLSSKVDRLQSRADKLDPARLAAARDKLLAKTQQAVAECDEANKAVLELTMARDAALAELGELKSKVEVSMIQHCMLVGAASKCSAFPLPRRTHWHPRQQRQAGLPQRWRRCGA